MDAPDKRPRGRPKGPDSAVINIRIPLDLLVRLDRYIDSELQWSHEGDINRATVMRDALQILLDERGF